MTAYRVRLGESEMTAEIDDPTSETWSGTVSDVTEHGAGPALISILDENGTVDQTADCEVIPSPQGQPFKLQGLRAFSRDS